MILAVKITKLEPHSGYYLKPGEKLITAKPIMELEAPDIVETYLKMSEFDKKNKKQKTFFITLCYYGAKTVQIL